MRRLALIAADVAERSAHALFSLADSLYSYGTG